MKSRITFARRGGCAVPPRKTTVTRLLPIAAAMALATTIAGCGGGGGGVTALPCEAITSASLGIAGLKVASAVRVAAKSDGATAADNYPGHCRVQGSINDRTGIDGK